MTEKMPADGGGRNKGAPDGVSASPGAAEVHGRTPGGESGGGGYDNPHDGKTPTGSGFFGHGGQTDIDYHGGGQLGEGGDAPNAATGSDSSDGKERGTMPPPEPARETHRVEAGGRSFEVLETSGVAQAEVTGKIGTDAQYEAEQHRPGSG